MRRCHHGTVRRVLFTAVGLLVLASCGGGVEREFERYYDPSGLFSAELPRDNTVQVLPADPGSGEGPQLLGGVQSVPAAPTPAQGLTGFGIQPTGTQDQTAYYVFAFSSELLVEVEDLARIYTSQPGVDVKIQEPVRIGGELGLLVVADNEAEGGIRFSVASGFLIQGRRGYWIAAAFPEGAWEEERDDFLKVLSSFRTRVPPGISAVPLTPG